jgi:hypothetical protein
MQGPVIPCERMGQPFITTVDHVPSSALPEKLATIVCTWTDLSPETYDRLEEGSRRQS